MPHSNGYRARTRYMFSKAFRQHGAPNVSTYLATFKRGDYVDIVANGSIHKGMPHRNYHGKTGKVWNVTPRAVGVLVNKQIRNKIVQKRIHVRIEHVRASKCRQDFLLRMKENNRLRTEAQKAGSKITIFRIYSNFFREACSHQTNPHSPWPWIFR
jgi:large subunit ribosomal protein L21e